MNDYFPPSSPDVSNVDCHEVRILTTAYAISIYITDCNESETKRGHSAASSTTI